MKTMSKILTFAAFFMLALFLSVSVSADTSVTDDGVWTFSVVDGNAVLEGYNGSAADIYVPSKIVSGDTEYAVTKLGDGIFKDNDAINSVTLGDGITDIGNEAFYDCDNLVCIVTNEGVLSIGDKAFYSCDNFNSVILYNSVTSIGTEAFSECPKLVIYCNENTAGHTYAVENGIAFEILNPAAEPELYTVDGITYYVANGEAVALSADKSLENVVIPGIVKGYPVTETRGTFKDNEVLKTVTLPSTLEVLGMETFEECKALTTVVLPEGLVSIGEKAFYNCRALTDVNIPSTVCNIGASAFYYCNSLAIEITIPTGVTIIDEYIFAYCSKLKKVNFHDNVTYIGNMAFGGCIDLTELSLPANLTHIGDTAFYNNTKITEVVIPAGVKSIGNSAFSSCYNISKVVLNDGLVEIEALAFYAAHSLTEISIPASVKKIGTSAFNSNKSLKDVKLCEGLEVVEKSAFAECVSLSYIRIPASVTELYAESFDDTAIWFVEKDSAAHNVAQENGNLYFVVSEGEEPEIYVVDGISYCIRNNEAIAFACDSDAEEIVIPKTVEDYPVTTLFGIFANNKTLRYVTLPEGLTTIGKKAFYFVYNLQEIEIPDTVTYIGEHAFTQCVQLKSLSIPGSVTEIGSFAFSANNINSLNLEEGLVTIGEGAFKSNDFTEINLPSTIKTIGEDSFGGCSNVVELHLNEGLEEIGPGALRGIKVEEIVFPSTLKSIGNAALFQNLHIKRLIFNEGLESIGNQAFQASDKLEYAKLPSTLKTLGDNAFADCTLLTEIVIPKSVTSICENSLSYNTLWCVYDGSYAQKFADENNLVYAKVGENGNTDLYRENGLGYVFRDGEAILAWADSALATQVTVPSQVNECPVTKMGAVFYNHKNISKVDLPNTITEIPSHVFEKSTITEITIPSSVKVIPEHAFDNCMSLTDVIISEGVEKIESYAFISCDGIKNVTIPSTIKSMPTFAFVFCDNIESVYISDLSAWCRLSFSISTSPIYSGADMYLDGELLEKLVIPEDITKLGYRLFLGCGSITSVHIPSNVSDLGFGAFSKCYNLKYASLAEGIKDLRHETFSYCTSLENVQLPESLETIRSKAFLECTALRTLYIPENVSLLEDEFVPKNVILLVHRDSYAHQYAVDNGYLYFILTKTDNPEISFGTTISGTVRYSDGSVAAGVTVELLYDDGQINESVVTDENGEYSFTYAEVGKYTIRATDSAALTASESVAVKRMNAFDVFVQGETDLVLKNSWTISGRADTDETVTISLFDTLGSEIDACESTDGTFAFENISNGSYIIRATTESASATVEVTVFNANVSGIVIEFPETKLYATVKGYVEVEDRNFERHRRHWVEVTIYNSDGVAVDSTRTDKEGGYIFKKLPADDYSIVAHTEELRPDKKKGHDHFHKLTGYAYVSVTEAVVYEVNIVLYEENDNQATISGKVTANGETQDCEVTLSDVFRNEIAHYTTKKNGKYSFTNISDGLYFITAVTKSDGMGFAVIVVRDGNVYGDTNIKVEKNQHIKDREQAWFEDVPELENREDAVSYRSRIAEEKRYFDGLSEKEKKQFSKDYRESLNKYAEWIADYEYSSSDESVKIENGGMLLSGDELESEDKVELVITVEKSSGHTISEGGIKTGEDYIQQSIENASGDSTIAEYYDISLLKKNGETEKTITNVCRDTETTGKIRITMDIPEEHRGHKHYSFVHVHNGQALTLADLDDNPDTVTFEIDRFSIFTLVYTDKSFVAEGDGDERLSFVGGQIRTDDPQGLRFVFSIDKAFYDTIEHPVSETDTGLGFGSVVMPKKYLGEENLEKDLETITNGKKKKAKTAPAVNLFEAKEDSVLFTVCILDIPESGYTEEYVAVPYATYIENGQEVTVYGNETANVTVFAIAELAYADENTSDETKQYIYDNILSVVDPEKYPAE